ncbi:hypothetical protein NDU88_005646 [Pleurodeles waltl]|uniref:Uncharacterized protein n=1 Tax=Pleurodeles waltl TaxID=8319 RepID=A0AAV7PNA4_PLEWA|nr:hypothetical protein NDU88_005646 [Pleurodeles waltl]
MGYGGLRRALIGLKWALLGIVFAQARTQVHSAQQGHENPFMCLRAQKQRGLLEYVVQGISLARLTVLLLRMCVVLASSGWAVGKLFGAGLLHECLASLQFHVSSTLPMGRWAGPLIGSLRMGQLSRFFRLGYSRLHNEGDEDGRTWDNVKLVTGNLNYCCSGNPHPIHYAPPSHPDGRPSSQGLGSSGGMLVKYMIMYSLVGAGYVRSIPHDLFCHEEIPLHCVMNGTRTTGPGEMKITGITAKLLLQQFLIGFEQVSVNALLQYMKRKTHVKGMIHTAHLSTSVAAPAQAAQLAGRIGAWREPRFIPVSPRAYRAGGTGHGEIGDIYWVI